MTREISSRSRSTGNRNKSNNKGRTKSEMSMSGLFGSNLVNFDRDSRIISPVSSPVVHSVS